MKRLALFAVLAALVASVATTVAVARTSGAGEVRITGLRVNPNKTVTLNWWLRAEEDWSNTSNWELTLDGRTIKSWDTIDKSTSWTSLKPLTPGRHTIKIESYTAVWTNKYYESLDCDVSTRDDYIYICSYIDNATRTFNVSGSATPKPRTTAPSAPSANECVVPDVVGLRLKDATARLNKYGCKLGAVRQAPSSRGGGTVLQQKPLPGKHFARGATVDLTIARY